MRDRVFNGGFNRLLGARGLGNDKKTDASEFFSGLLEHDLYRKTARNFADHALSVPEDGESLATGSRPIDVLE
jgi:hypothetical protein